MYNAGRSFSQPAATKVRLPSEQWVTLKVVLHLARDGSGTSQVWQDGTLIIDAAGRNFPVEATITRYNWVEFGLTANSSALAQTVWIDDVDLSIR